MEQLCTRATASKLVVHHDIFHHCERLRAEHDIAAKGNQGGSADLAFDVANKQGGLRIFRDLFYTFGQDGDRLAGDQLAIQRFYFSGIVWPGSADNHILGYVHVGQARYRGNG